MFSLFPLYFSVYMSMSASLYHCYLSLHLFGRLWGYFSVCCFLLIFHLTHPSFLSLYISLTFPYLLDSFFSYLFSFKLEKDWESYLYTVLYLTSSVTTASSQASCISNSSLVKEDRNPPSTSFPELLWEGYNGVATAMLVAVMLRLPIYQAPYIHHFTIPRISYLEGLNRYIPPFYQRGHWDRTWSYGLPNITEQNLYSNLCLSHRICIKFL